MRGFLFGGYGAEYARAEHLGHLRDEPAGAAGRGVHQAGIAASSTESGVREVMGGHALQHGRGGGREIHVIRES